MNKKFIVIIIGVLGMVLIGSGIILSLNKNETVTENETTSNTKTSKVEDTIKDFYSDSSTKLKIEKKLNLEISAEEIPLGKDSYLKQTFGIEDDDYKKVQDEYSKKIEDYILSKFKYSIKESSIDKNIVEVKIKSYNYYEFIYDLCYLKAYLEQSTGISSALIDENYQEYSKYSYKALVKAMTIMYSYIDNYNNDEETTIELDYNSENINEEYYKLFTSLIHEDISLEVDETKVHNILNKAIADGIVKEKDPLSIN